MQGVGASWMLVADDMWSNKARIWASEDEGSTACTAQILQHAGVVPLQYASSRSMCKRWCAALSALTVQRRQGSASCLGITDSRAMRHICEIFTMQ